MTQQQLSIDAALTPGLSESKRDVRLLPVLSFVLIVLILGVVAVISDGSLTSDQRIQLFQHSGVYP
jgi:hypothetical protein